MQYIDKKNAIIHSFIHKSIISTEGKHKIREEANIMHDSESNRNIRKLQRQTNKPEAPNQAVKFQKQRNQTIIEQPFIIQKIHGVSIRIHKVSF